MTRNEHWYVEESCIAQLLAAGRLGRFDPNTHRPIFQENEDRAGWRVCRKVIPQASVPVDGHVHRQDKASPHLVFTVQKQRRVREPGREEGHKAEWIDGELAVRPCHRNMLRAIVQILRAKEGRSTAQESMVLCS